LSLDQAFDIYRQRFSDASGFTFVFVGSFNVAAITPLLEKYLGALPATHKGEQARDLGIHIPAGVMDHTLYRGTEQRATVYLVFSGPFDYSRENLIRLDALKECLEIRMLERLREDESGVYSPGVTARASKYPDGRYSFTVHFGCAPQNADKLVASALDEIRRLRTDGPLQVNLDKWRAEDKASRETTVRTNNWWLDYIGGQLADKADLHELDLYRAQADAVTRDAVKAMAQQCLSGDNYIRFEWLPARGAEGAKPDSHPAGN
jgi:zinc protease